MSTGVSHRSKGTIVQDVEGIVRDAVAEAKAYLASPEGQRLRSRAATGLILAAPIIARLPFMKATPLGRLVGLAGGAAVLVKVGELIRDWEPDLADVPLRP